MASSAIRNAARIRCAADSDPKLGASPIHLHPHLIKVQLRWLLFRRAFPLVAHILRHDLPDYLRFLVSVSFPCEGIAGQQCLGIDTPMARVPSRHSDQRRCGESYILRATRNVRIPKPVACASTSCSLGRSYRDRFRALLLHGDASAFR